MPHGGPAALGRPPPAPRNGVVGGVPVPGGLAVGDERAAERPLPQQSPYLARAGAEPVLEDDGGVRSRVPGLLGGLDGIEVGEGRAGRLLAPHPGPRLQRGHRLVAVHGGRCAQHHEIGVPFGQGRVEVRRGVRNPGMRPRTRAPRPCRRRRRRRAPPRPLRRACAARADGWSARCPRCRPRRCAVGWWSGAKTCGPFHEMCGERDAVGAGGQPGPSDGQPSAAPVTPPVATACYRSVPTL